MRLTAESYTFLVWSDGTVERMYVYQLQVTPPLFDEDWDNVSPAEKAYDDAMEHYVPAAEEITRLEQALTRIYQTAGTI